MTAKRPYRCGHCATAASVRAGTRYGRYRPTTGETEWFTTDEALDHLARLCRCADRAETVTAGEVGREVVAEIRRDGQRILRPGVNVAVQLRRRKGTKVHRGHVVECYADGHVKVDVGTGSAKVPHHYVVLADEWVRARQGLTPIREAVAR